jgi:hypothetical protein
MRIRTRQFATIFILLTSFLLAPVTLKAQAGTSDWSLLSSVASGSKLSVKLRNGKKIDGRLSSVSDTSLTLMVKNTATDIKRDDISSVHTLNGTSTKKATLIGLGLGAGAGAIAGVALDAGADSGRGFEDFDNAVAGAITIIGAGVGALAGYLVGRSGKKKVLIYEAK